VRSHWNRFTVAEWASAVLTNGLGRYRDALAAAQQASESASEVIHLNWALPELIETAVRRGQVG
jgi:hypothetical protein